MSAAGTAPGPAPRRRRWPWIVLALGVFLVVLVVSAPAGVVARIVNGQSDAVRLLAPTGSLWSGAGRLRVDGIDVGELRWRLAPGALAEARAAADLVLVHPGHRATARASVGPDGALRIDGLDAVVEEASLDALLRPYAIEPTGRVTIGPGGRLRADAAGVRDAAAEGHWTGGTVRYRLAGQAFFADLPPLDAELTTRDGTPVLLVRQTDGAELLELRLRRDGWVDLRMRYRLAALAGFPWPNAPAPDAVVLELSEQIL